MAQDIGKTITFIAFFLGIVFVLLSITNQFDITNISLKSALFFLLIGISMSIVLNLVFGQRQDGLISVVSIFALIGIGYLFFSFPQLVPISFSSIDIQNNPISNALTGNNFSNFPWLGILLAIIVLFVLNKAFRENAKAFFNKIRGRM